MLIFVKLYVNNLNLNIYMKNQNIVISNQVNQLENQNLNLFITYASSFILIKKINVQ